MAMKLGELYRLAVRLGIERDPRPKDDVKEDMRRAEQRYQKLEGKERERFDQDSLWNPFPDSRLLFGDEAREVRGVLWGIDIGTGEVLLADRLREKGRKVDVVIGHHPVGRARITFPEALHTLESMIEDVGVPANVAEGVIAGRIREVHNVVTVENVNQPVDAARLLDMPIMCLHSCTDVLVQHHLRSLLAERKPRLVEDVVNAFLEEPEFDHMARLGNPPKVLVGDKTRKAGKIMVKMAGGTSGPKEMYERLAAAGVGTYICMHMPDAHLEEARKHHMNIITAAHMAADSMGVNLLADEVESQGVEIIPCSGFIRVRRK